MHPYFVSQGNLASRARSTSFVQPLGQVRARAKASCIHFKTRQGNFRSACKEIHRARGTRDLFRVYLTNQLSVIKCRLL